MKPIKLNIKTAPYVFILPFILMFVAFFLFPLGSSFIMSFQEVYPGEITWIGLKNYKNLLNPVFFKAVLNSLTYMILTLIILIPIPLLLAILIHKSKLKGTRIFKSVLFLPALTSIVIASIVFRFMFGELPNSQANIIISWFGLEPIKWLKSEKLVFPILVFVASWRWMGVNMLYFLAGLANVNDDILEAAEIEGANPLQKYWYIVIPLLKPITIYVLTISIYAGLAMFAESMMIYTINSPNDMALTIVGYLYKLGIQQNNMGLASAVGTFLLLFALILNLMQLKFTGFFKKD